MLRLIATDLDGTFLNSERKISQANREAVQACIDQGVIFCLASGRGISTMDHIAEELGISGPIVSSNGAYVTGLSGEDIHHFSLPPAAQQIIVEFALQNDIHLNCYAKRVISFSKPGPFADMYIERTGCQPEISPIEAFNDFEPTKLLYIDHPEKIESYRKQIEPMLAPHNIAVVVSEPDYVEFLPPGINKGKGLQELCRNLKISREEVAAIGDWWNDQEMIEWAGISGAVANAAPEVKSAANHHVSTNDQNGAAEFIYGVLDGTLKGIVSA